MRPDMDKVIVERPRRKAYNTRKGRPPRDIEDQASAKTGRRLAKETGDYKQLNENLAPFKRFLEKQVGRPWNKVFSEITERIKPGNTVQEHVLGHIDDFITRKVMKVPPSDQHVCGLRGQGGAFGWIRTVRPGQLYVDPDDNIIKIAKQRFFRPVQRQAKREAVWLDQKRICFRHEGIWYSAEAMSFKIYSYQKQVPWKNPYSDKRPVTITRTFSQFIVEGERVDTISDAFMGLLTTTETLRLLKRYGVKETFGKHGTAKQLNTKELKRLGLKNEDPKDD